MSLLFNNRYRIESSRLQSWNYGNAGMYFITICTANREFYFGDVINGDGCGVETQCITSLHHNHQKPQYQMNLSPIGKIAEIWHPSFADLNRLLQPMHAKTTFPLIGNHDILITLSDLRRNIYAFQIIL